MVKKSMRRLKKRNRRTRRRGGANAEDHYTNLTNLINTVINGTNVDPDASNRMIALYYQLTPDQKQDISVRYNQALNILMYDDE